MDTFICNEQILTTLTSEISPGEYHSYSPGEISEESISNPIPSNLPSYNDIFPEKYLEYELDIKKTTILYMPFFVSNILIGIFMFCLYFISDFICSSFNNNHTCLFVLIFSKSFIEPVLFVAINKTGQCNLIAAMIINISILLYSLYVTRVIFLSSFSEECSEDYILLIKIIDIIVIILLFISIYFTLRINSILEKYKNQYLG